MLLNSASSSSSKCESRQVGWQKLANLLWVNFVVFKHSFETFLQLRKEKHFLNTMSKSVSESKHFTLLKGQINLPTSCCKCTKVSSSFPFFVLWKRKYLPNELTSRHSGARIEPKACCYFLLNVTLFIPLFTGTLLQSLAKYNGLFPYFRLQLWIIFLNSNKETICLNYRQKNDL